MRCKLADVEAHCLTAVQELRQPFSMRCSLAPTRKHTVWLTVRRNCRLNDCLAGCFSHLGQGSRSRPCLGQFWWAVQTIHGVVSQQVIAITTVLQVHCHALITCAMQKDSISVLLALCQRTYFTRAKATSNNVNIPGIHCRRKHLETSSVHYKRRRKRHKTKKDTYLCAAVAHASYKVC